MRVAWQAGGLLAVALGLGGCGGGSAAKSSAPSLEDPAVPLVWHATTPSGGAPSQAQMTAAARLLTQRLREGLPRSGPVSVRAAARPVVVRGANELVLPRALAGAPSSTVRPLTVTGRLELVDWEPNVIGPGGRVAPTDASVTGGAEAGLAGAAVSLYSAVMRAERSRAGGGRPSFYLLSTHGHAVLAGPSGSPPAPVSGSRVVVVRAPVTIVGAQTPDGAPNPALDIHYVLRDVPVVTNGDIVDPRPGLDKGLGAGGAPIVSFRFTRAGRRRMEALSRVVAERGANVSLPGANRFQHFAILLDGRIVAVPFVNFVAFPAGIDLSAGAQIEGGMSQDGARGLASVLRFGPLPVRLAPLDSGR